MPSPLGRSVVAIAAALALAPSPARADVPSKTFFVNNAVEVKGQEKFPDWIVVVFPGGPPSGRPVAWPSLVEPDFQTEIDRMTLGEPRLWILPRAAMEELAAAARDNDNALDGPVADLLKRRGADCGRVDLIDKATQVMPAPENRLITYLLEDAAPGRCQMKFVGAELQMEDFKRPPTWARFAPRKKKADAGAPSATPSPPAPPAASAAPAASTTAAPPATSTATEGPATRAAREPEVPQRAGGCGACAVGDEGSGAGRGALAGAALVLALLGRRRRSPRRGG